LRQESERLDTERRRSISGSGRGEIQQDIIRREVVTVVDPCDMVKVSMNKERGLITASWSVMRGLIFVYGDLHGEHDEVENHERYETEKSKLEAIRREEV